MVTIQQAEAKRKSYGLPAAFEGRIIISSDDLGREVFCCDEPAIIRRTPKKVQKQDGTVIDIYDDLLFLPLIIKIRPEEKRVLRTNSKELISTIRAIGYAEFTEDEAKKTVLQLIDQTITGNLRLCDKPHQYANGKTYDQLYIEEIPTQQS